MKKYYILLAAILISGSIHSFAQTLTTESNTTRKKIGWYITPEFSTLFLDNHVGNAVGVSFGLNLLKDHLKVGAFAYGRSGPINSKTFNTSLQEGISYKGKSSLDLRADHGAFGLMIAPAFYLPHTNIEIDFPIYIGSIGAGFYLAGEDRKTPDGRRVSEWENELFDGKDASFAGMMEFGVRAFVPTRLNGLKWGIGLHYTTVQDWTTYADPKGDFYNNKLRASVFVNFGSKSNHSN